VFRVRFKRFKCGTQYTILHFTPLVSILCYFATIFITLFCVFVMLFGVWECGMLGYVWWVWVYGVYGVGGLYFSPAFFV
jgi:hypothetical protein